MKKSRKSTFLLLSLVISLVFIITAFAGCGEKTYSVSFESNGGSSVSEVSTGGTNIIMPVNPVKDGFTFEGWYYDSGFSNQFKADKLKENPISSDIKLYAKWTAIEMTGIYVKTQPNKKEYTVGESFDAEGVEVAAVYNNGDTETVTGYTIGKTDPLALSDTKIPVTYNDLSTHIIIKVNPEPVLLIGITVTAPTKTVYREGELFDTAGMVVTAEYSNSTTAPVTEYTIDKTDALTTNDKSVKISYENFDETIAITVASLAGITVTAQPTKTVYAIGETFDPTGMTVDAVYSEDNLEQDVTALCQVDTSTKFTGSESSVEITYKTVNTTVPITIIRMTGISVVTNPDKMIYYEGDLFETAGMVVNAIYQGADPHSVTGYTIDKPGPLTATDTEIKISYNDFDTTIAITVNSITGILIESPPSLTTFFEGQKFNTTGMVVKAVYSDGHKVEITDYTIDKTGALAIGDDEVQISYKGFTEPVAITVVADTRADVKIEAETAFLVDGESNPETGPNQTIGVGDHGQASGGKHVSGWGNNLGASAYFEFNSDKDTYALLSLAFGYGGSSRDIDEFLSVTVNGTRVFAPGVKPASTGWNEYTQTVFAEVLLTEGRNMIGVIANSYETYINFDYISLKTNATISAYVPQQVEGTLYKFEAESAKFTGGAGGSFVTDEMFNNPSGGGYAGGFDSTGRTMSFELNAEEDVTATLRFCMNRKNTSFSSIMKCTVNGNLLFTNASIPSDIVFPNEWYDWKDFILGNIELTAGTNTITFEVTSAGFNVDYVSVVSPVPVAWAV